MKNKQLHEERMRGYFLQATKEMLKAEGLKSVSVRSIAEKAGYSYATLYSYFKDVQDLVFLCVHDFYEECRQYVISRTGEQEMGMQRLKAMIKTYVEFFIQYPGIFELFFLEKMDDLGNRKPAVQLITLSLDRICEEQWNYCISRNLVSPEGSEEMKEQLRSMVTGSLLLYLNRRTPDSYPAFIRQFNGQLDGIIRPKSDAADQATGTGSSQAARKSGAKRKGGSTINNSLITIKVGNNP